MSLNSFDINSVSPVELLKLVKKAGGQRAFAKAKGIARTTLQDRLHKLKRQPFTHRPAPKAKRVGEKRGIRRFILTSAQDSTLLHEEFLTNLEAYRDWLRQTGTCEILVAGFTYNKSLFEDHSKHAILWPDRIKPYMTNERTRIADKIDFCGEINILPTATSPLSDLQTYTQDRWGIFPHAKVQLISVPRAKHLPPKMVMTTGTCTKANYVPKKAGAKASFHHVFGAVLVEIDKDGDFFCRHLLGDDNGDFYDLDREVKAGVVTTGTRISVLVPGDIHVSQICPAASKTIFGTYPINEQDANGVRTWMSVESSIVSALRPENIFLHDTSDFVSRNHHNIGDPHFRFKMYCSQLESVENEINEVGMFVSIVSEIEPESKVWIVDSNHDQALKKWLQNGDYRTDPVNALFFLKCQTAQYEAIKREDKKFSILEHAIRHLGCWPCPSVTFLREDKDPVVINGVDCSNHGHRGPNGSRGAVASLVKVASKQTIGHVHSPQIHDGLYAAGTTSKMDLSYNSGPTSWAPTLVAQYANGKRTMITLQGEKWKV